MGIRDRPTSLGSLWEDGYAERLMGSIRRECTDHLIVFSAEHLRRILANMPPITMRYELTFRLGRMRPAPARSSGTATLSRTRSSAGYTLGMHGSDFRQRQPPPFV